MTGEEREEYVYLSLWLKISAESHYCSSSPVFFFFLITEFSLSEEAFWIVPIGTHMISVRLLVF